MIIYSGRVNGWFFHKPCPRPERFTLPDILFICTANQFRSPIAAACFSRKLERTRIHGEWSVGSAGTWTVNGSPAHPKAVEVANAMGLDLKTHQTRVVTNDLLHKADLVVVMQSSHKEALETEFQEVRGRVVLLGNLAGISGGDITDPAAEQFSQPETTARIINSCIEKAFPKLVEYAFRQEIIRKQSAR